MRNVIEFFHASKKVLPIGEEIKSEIFGNYMILEMGTILFLESEKIEMTPCID